MHTRPNPPLSTRERAERRARAMRRRRRRRVGALVAVAGVLAVAGVALRMSGGDGGAAPAGTAARAARTASTTTAGATRTAPATPRAVPAGGPEGVPVAQARAAVRRVSSLGVPVFRSAGAHGKLIALTFDDGPGPYTQQTLDLLRRYRQRATFFLVGSNVARFPGMARRETALAEVGDHSWSHAYLPGLSGAAMTDQVVRTQRTVAAATGEPVTVFRPPYGAHSAAIDRTVTGAGMLQVLWSIDSGDSVGAGYKEMLTRIKTGIRPGAIILLHENRGQTQMTLNRLLPWLAKHGWRSVTVPELLALDPPSEGQVRDAARRTKVTSYR